MPSQDARKAKVFMNGRSRAVRIPREFDFDGDEVIFRKDGDGKLTLEPVRRKLTPRELIAWLRSQPRLERDFPDIEDFPPEPIDLDLPK
jgi:antitoxin VapB